MKLLGLIGKPLTHSFSPTYFKEKFLKLGIEDMDYRTFPLEGITELPGLLQAEPEIIGLNVTIPYKEAVIPYLHRLDETAEKAGAVNTIKVQRKSGDLYLEGFNTDMYGFRESIRPYLKASQQRALVLGTGGAARAVGTVLRVMGIDFLRVSREPGRGDLCYSDLNAAAVKQFPFIINCSPAGMYPLVDDCPPIPYQYLGEGNYLYDLVYNPAETLFMKQGRAKGAMVQGGLSMLQFQADRAWEIFNG